MFFDHIWRDSFRDSLESAGDNSGMTTASHGARREDYERKRFVVEFTLLSLVVITKCAFRSLRLKYLILSANPLSSVGHLYLLVSICLQRSVTYDRAHIVMATYGGRFCLEHCGQRLQTRLYMSDESPLERIKLCRSLFSLDSVVLSIVLLNTFTASAHAASRFISGL